MLVIKREGTAGITARLPGTKLLRKTWPTVIVVRLVGKEKAASRTRPSRYWYMPKYSKFITVMSQNKSSTSAWRFLVHFFDVHFTTTTRNLPMWRLRRTWTKIDEFSFLFLKLEKVLKNSSPRLKIRLHLTNWTSPNRRDKVLKDAKSFFF